MDTVDTLMIAVHTASDAMARMALAIEPSSSSVCVKALHLEYSGIFVL